MDKDGYPELHELTAIENWSCDDVPGLIKYIHDRWTYAEAGYFLNEGRLLELRTAGWSGNEEIIRALHRNRRFWQACWESSRGANHFFEIAETIPEVDAEEVPISISFDLLPLTTWDIMNDFSGMIDFIQSHWIMKNEHSLGWDGKALYLITGNDARNTEIICALRRNTSFWFMCIHSMDRFGNFEFIIPKALIKSARSIFQPPPSRIRKPDENKASIQVMTGKTDSFNAATDHIIPVGSLVELESGERLRVMANGQVRDNEQLYSLGISGEDHLKWLHEFPQSRLRPLPQ